jgi:ADP-ribose pyrophosphatase YjhB (NUDIX family)
MMIEYEAFLGGTKLVPFDKLTFRPGAYGLIVKDGKVLVLTNRRTGKLSLPGGGVEIGEKLVDGLLRELREETGIAVRVEEMVHFQESLLFTSIRPLTVLHSSFAARC